MAIQGTWLLVFSIMPGCKPACSDFVGPGGSSSARSIKVWPHQPNPIGHPLHRSSRFSGVNISVLNSNIAGIDTVRWAPGFCAFRPHAAALDNLTKLWEDIDHIHDAEDAGGLNIGNTLWPSAGITFHPNFTEFASQLKARRFPIARMSGFCPSGSDQVDFNNNSPGGAIGYWGPAPYNGPGAHSYLQEGTAILGELMGGQDMAEMDDRYTYAYSKQWVHSTPSTVCTGDAGNICATTPGSYVRLYKNFMDWNLALVQDLGGKMTSLQHTPGASHYYAKTGLYSMLGSETASSAHNAQTVYSFVRGAARQYGTSVLGQVSVFSTFRGFKSYGYRQYNASLVCKSGESGPQCGTSLSLMKRLLYTEMAYDAVWFGLEGGWTYGPHNKSLSGAITPIGRLQAAAKRFFSSADTIDMGVHVPTIAIMLDFHSGWHRPCDGGGLTLRKQSVMNWGKVPYDFADYFTENVFQTVFPHYRSFAMDDERGHLVPTPYGDAVDTLLSDALPSVLAHYDTLILPHRLTTEPAETRRKIDDWVQNGGHLFVTASTVLDLGGKLLHGDVIAISSVCKRASYDGQNISVCPLTINASSSHLVVTDEIRIDGMLTSAYLRFSQSEGGGSVRIASVGNYASANGLDASKRYQCYQNAYDTGSESSPFTAVTFAQRMLESALESAQLFDLGRHLAWVPRRIDDKRYTLTVTNNDLLPHPLAIQSKIGAIASVAELPLDQSEKITPIGFGWLPYGYDNQTVREGLGESTNDTIQGGDTRVFVITLAKDNTTAIPEADAYEPSVASQPRLLRLSAGAGSIRDEILKRPSFRNYYVGVVLDWTYIDQKDARALEEEARWLTWQKLQVVVDFTSGTTLFPGPLRMADDWWWTELKNCSAPCGPWYLRGQARIVSVLKKMPLVGALDAVLTLHGTGGIGGGKPPHNICPGGPMAVCAASVALFRHTFAALEKVASPLNITLHLRQTGRNGVLRQSTRGFDSLNLSSQVDFVRSICPGQAVSCVKIAPAFAYLQHSNGSLAEVEALVEDGTATLLLLSAEIQSNDPTCQFTPGRPTNGQNCRWRHSVAPGGPPGGGDDADGPTEGALLVSLNEQLRARLRGWAVLAAKGAGSLSPSDSSNSLARAAVRLVMDATPTAEGAVGREAELADVVLLNSK